MMTTPKFGVVEMRHGETGVHDFHVIDLRGHELIAECATRAEAEVRARVEQIRDLARSSLWSEGELPLGDLLELLKAEERDDAIISRAITSMLSEDLITLDADRVVKLATS